MSIYGSRCLRPSQKIVRIAYILKFYHLCKPTLGSQVGLVVISLSRPSPPPSPPLPPLRPRIEPWAPHVVCDLSISISLPWFSPGTPVFLPPQIWLSRQDLSRRAIKHWPLARKNGQPLPSQLMLIKVFIICCMWLADCLSTVLSVYVSCHALVGRASGIEFCMLAWLSNAS